MVRLAEKDKTEYYFTIGIIILDLITAICLFISGGCPLRKFGTGKAYVDWKTKDQYNALKETGCSSGVKLRAFSQRKMYICCFIAGILYIVAFGLDITKIFVEFTCYAQHQWILTIAARFIIFALAISGSLCNWDYFNQEHRCQNKDICKNNHFDYCAIMRTMKICFIIVLICVVIGFVLEIVVSLLYRKTNETRSAESQSEIQPVTKREDKVYA